MKKLLINLFLLLIFAHCFAQNEEVLSYRLTINDRLLGDKVEQNLIVYVHGASSIELVIRPRNISNIEKSSNELSQIKVIKTKPYFIYKDFSAKKLLLSDYVGAKKYLITDTLNNFNWNITNERKKIGNFNCKKASTVFRGRFYEAWYTDDVPLRNGPWNFCGLPGLIVKVKDKNSDFVYELTGLSLKAKFDQKLVSIPSGFANERAFSYKEFRALYKKKLEDNIKLSRITQVTPEGITGKVTITLPEKQEKF